MILLCCAIVGLIVAAVGAIGGNYWMIPLGFVGGFLAAFVVAALFLVIACACVDLEKPREKESKFYRTILTPYINMLVKLFRVRVNAKGLEKVPTDGRFMLVCNHLSTLDPGLVLYCLPKSQLFFISKKENRDLPIVNKFMHALRCQLLDRDNDRQALRIILNCIKMVKDDEGSVAVFPEGYVSLTGKLLHFRSGVFKIAQKANVPIVVCTIRGTPEVFDKLKKLQPSTVDFHLVDVIPAEELVGKTTAEIGDRVYEMMIADMGEEYRMEA